MRGLILAAGAIAGLATVGSGRIIRLLRWLDRRSGLFAPHGARLYSVVAPLALRGLYGRVADDAERIVGQRAIARKRGGSVVEGAADALPLPDDRPLAVVCAGGYRSTLINLIGGVTAYEAAGHQLVHDEASPQRKEIRA